MNVLWATDSLFTRLTLAATEQVTETVPQLEFTLPKTPLEWGLYAGGFLVALFLVVLVYLIDTAGMSIFWKIWLTLLRLSVVVGLIVIALNPHHRIENKAFRPSRAALVIDTSLSMRYPETLPPAGTPVTAGAPTRTRTEAIIDVLKNSPLIEELRQKHELSIYTFDSELSGPHHVFYPPSANAQPDEQPAAKSADGSSTKPGAAVEGEDPEKPASETQKPELTEAEKRALTAADLDWEELLRPRGLETRLGESVLALNQRIAGKTLSGVLIFSDGGANAGIDAETANADARNKQVRLVTIGVGSTERPVNLKIASVQAPTEVHKNDPYDISVFVQGQSLAGRDVEVQLFSKPLDSDREPESVPPTTTTPNPQVIRLREDGVPVEVKFNRTATEEGSQEFVVRTKPVTQVHEISDEDNEFRKTINVIERNTSVLIIAGGPTRDYSFVRNMLYRHPAVDIDVWLQSVDPATVAQVSQESDDLLTSFPEEFPRRPISSTFEKGSKRPEYYDVILAFDPNWKLIPAEKIKDIVHWVSELSGGMFVVAGDVYTPDLATADGALADIQKLYPVFLNSYLLDFQFDSESDKPWPLAFTREGREAGFLQLTDNTATAQDVWQEFEGVYRCYPTGGRKAGAAVYAEFTDPRAAGGGERPILLASHFYGAGRVMYLGSGETWRLRALSDEYYDRLWTKMIREVGQGRLKQGTNRAMLLPERNEYFLGQTVRVRARLLDPQLKPLEVESVRLEVFDPQGRQLVPDRILSRDPNRPGEYIGDFRAGLAGKYSMILPVPDSTTPEKSEIFVKLPNLESDNPQQNAKLLTDLARDAYGGKYLRLEEFTSIATGLGSDSTKAASIAELNSLLPNRSEEFFIPEKPRTLWDRDWVLFVLVGVLSIEWLTRKLLKLA